MLEQMDPDRSKRKYSPYYRPVPYSDKRVGASMGEFSPKRVKLGLLDWFKKLLSRRP